MRPSISRLASTSASLPLSLSQASAQLMPPIPLYRRLLRVHRYLPEEMRFMGDSYVKSEFRLTRGTDNPLHIIAFLSQWKIYLDELESSLQAQLGQVARKGKGKATEMTWSGRKLNVEAFEKMSGEQVGQLYELMHATKDVWKSPDELEAEAQAAEDDAAGGTVDQGKRNG